jgi:hypothetical protein
MVNFRSVLMRIWGVDGGLYERGCCAKASLNDDDMPKPYFISGDGRGSSGSPSALEVTDGDEI